jgi:hypothetical protein
MGLLHFGQVGGGEFLGMTLTLDQARVLPNSLSPINAEAGAAIVKVYRLIFGCRSGLRLRFQLISEPLHTRLSGARHSLRPRIGG